MFTLGERERERERELDSSSHPPHPSSLDRYSPFPLSSVLYLLSPRVLSSTHHVSVCVTHLLSDFFDRLYAGSIQMVVILAGLDELVFLDLLLHEFSGGHEVIISAVHLVVSPRPRCV